MSSRFNKLIIGEKEFVRHSDIIDKLRKHDLFWLIDQEFDNATIEIKKNTLIWHDGYFSGDWHYGIFKNGEFHGNFKNGIFENGIMRGKFLSGINKLQPKDYKK